MGKLVFGLAVAAAMTLIGFGLAARAARPSVAQPHLVSMEASAGSLEQAGQVMMAHAERMLADGQRSGDQDLLGHAAHWREDGQMLVRRGQWLAMRPLAPGSLLTSPAELSAQRAWGDLLRNTETMLHDPSHARELDIEALRWNGLAMQAEGQLMVDHGRVMAEEVDLIIARHGLSVPAASELRQAVDAMREVGGHLATNGRTMMDYAQRLRQSMGFR